VRLKTDVGSERHRDAVRLKAWFHPGRIPLEYDPVVDGVSLEIGPATVIDLSAPETAAEAWRVRNGRWVCRQKSAAGNAKLVLDLAGGRISLRTKRLWLSRLHGVDPAGVDVTLVLGQQVFTAQVDFDRRGSTWFYKAPNGLVRQLPDPGPPPPPPPPPPPGELTFREIDTGDMSLITVAQNAVARSQAEWQTLWTLHKGCTKCPLPYVDFSKEIVVGIFLGTRGSSGFWAEVESAEAQGTGMKVSYVEKQYIGANCGTLPAVFYPYQIVAVTRVSGPVTFAGTTKVMDCK
ncbi:MAG: hypothetical protein ACYS99_12115, partial [Planctomycetota bacterium]